MNDVYSVKARTGQVVPGEGWNVLVDETTMVAGDREAALKLTGSYVANAALQEGAKFAETADAFVEAAKPPMKPEEECGFREAFSDAEMLRGPLRTVIDRHEHEMRGLA